MNAMNKETFEQVKEILSDLDREVRLIYFFERYSCGGCEGQRKILEELAKANDRIVLEFHELSKEFEVAESYGVDKVPCTCVVGKEDHGIHFYGMSAGYEFTSLVEAVLMVGTGRSGLPQSLVEFAARITKPLHLEVMVTLSCPYCQRMVRLANQLAFENKNISVDMIEAAEFPMLVQKYSVTGAPKTVLNRDPAHSFDGAIPPLNVILELLKVSDPEEFERLEGEIRKAQGFKARQVVEENRIYDVLIVGAGPAAMSAAIYASRKALDVAMVGWGVGGQVTNTANVENWLGIPSISGADMALLFKNHVERYPIDEKLNEKISEITKKDGVFEIRSDSGARYRAKSVVYAAGKEYRRLGVPGEEKFIGKGVAFCATCDAPLYQGKRVAVIGGGNSAFTAARDLLPFAREIFVINNTDHFIADPALIAEVGRSKQVVLYNSSETKGFLGDDKLTGVRIHGPEGHLDLPVEGVFLEIGLVPNSKPLRKLLHLNSLGEVPVERDQSTDIEGLFAAGDVTDEDEKQIVIAAGAGAKAALSAYQYLKERHPHLESQGERDRQDWEQQENSNF